MIVKPHAEHAVWENVIEEFWMLSRSLIGTAFFLFLIVSSGAWAAQSGSARAVEFSDGLISIAPGEYAVAELLEEVSKAAGFEVVRIGDAKGEGRVTVSYDGKRPEEIVRSLLIGQSYAIIYSGRGATKTMGSRIQTHPVAAENKEASSVDKRQEPQDLQAKYGISENDTPRERRLKVQISELKKRIESGRSDQAYETWTSARDPRYVVHEEDLLQQLEEKLTNEIGVKP